MNYFVIQCYGKERILREAKFCVLSLLKYIKDNPAYQIVLYTDKVDFFPDLENNVIIEHLPLDRVQEWKGPQDFVHRVKIMLLLDFVSKYKGKFIYLDSDTWFRGSPEVLFETINNSNALLHLPEAQLDSGANPIIKKIGYFIAKNTFEIEGEIVKIPASFYMWNAGVIGLPENSGNVLNKVLQLTDAMLQLYQKHVMEQLAFSYYLQKEFAVHRCDAIIEHYWQHCATAEPIMTEFFNSIAELPLDKKIKAVDVFDWDKGLTPPEKKSGLKNLFASWGRLFRAISNN